MPSQDAAAVRRQHAAAVLANRVRADARWDRPCLAFIVIARPDAAAASALAALQQDIADHQPGLLIVPQSAMHASVARLLPVDGNDQAKQAVWDRRGEEWLAALRASAASIKPADIVLDELIATDAAIIAAGSAPGWVGELRAAVACLAEVGDNISSGGLVHVTLFRYSGRLADPARLLDTLAGLRVKASLPAGALPVIRELTFPCLDYQILDTLNCGPGQPGQPSVTAR
jgi:hypothetical protein